MAEGETGRLGDERLALQQQPVQDFRARHSAASQQASNVGLQSLQSPLLLLPWPAQQPELAQVDSLASCWQHIPLEDSSDSSCSRRSSSSTSSTSSTSRSSGSWGRRRSEQFLQLGRQDGLVLAQEGQHRALSQQFRQGGTRVCQLRLNRLRCGEVVHCVQVAAGTARGVRRGQAFRRVPELGEAALIQVVELQQHQLLDRVDRPHTPDLAYCASHAALHPYLAISG
mmetsp:Transcript_18985/g.37468  ORF Transcript_18985/g.37468 Transcript_18985/m.37468 type:complete len:227 (+) Transcript_18985:527-1207(+)